MALIKKYQAFRERLSGYVEVSFSDFRTKLLPLVRLREWTPEQRQYVEMIVDHGGDYALHGLFGSKHPVWLEPEKLAPLPSKELMMKNIVDIAALFREMRWTCDDLALFILYMQEDLMTPTFLEEFLVSRCCTMDRYVAPTFDGMTFTGEIPTGVDMCECVGRMMVPVQTTLVSGLVVAYRAAPASIRKLIENKLSSLVGERISLGPISLRMMVGMCFAAGGQLDDIHAIHDYLTGKTEKYPICFKPFMARAEAARFVDEWRTMPPHCSGEMERSLFDAARDARAIRDRLCEVD